MSSLKRWRRIGEGQFHKWETPGEELQGVWRGVHDGRFGALGTVETAEDLRTFALPVALRERILRVPPGAEVLIRYTGLQTSKAGRVFKGFEVFVLGDEAWADPGPAPVALVRRAEE